MTNPAEIHDDKYLLQLKKRFWAYGPKGRQLFHYHFNVLVVVLIRVFIDRDLWGLAVWLVGLDHDGFRSFYVTATVRAGMAGWLLLKSYSSK